MTFKNQSFFARLRVEIEFRAVRLRDVFRLWFFNGTYPLLPLFLLRSCMWLWGVWLGRSVAKRVCEVGRSAVFEVYLVFGL